MSFLNTSGNLLGTSGQIGIKEIQHRNSKFSNLDAEALIRDGFGIFGKPSGTIRDVLKPITINLISSESLPNQCYVNSFWCELNT